MGSLRKCLDKLRKAFSDEEAKVLTASSDKYKAEGKGELEADTQAVLDYADKLNEDLNTLRKKATLKPEPVAKQKLEKEEILPEVKKKEKRYPHGDTKIDFANEGFETKVLDFKDPDDLKGYPPEVQMKFNQGEYFEPVRIIVPEEIKVFYNLGNTPTSRLTEGQVEQLQKLNKKYGIHYLDLIKKLKDIAKENRDKYVEKIVEIYPKSEQSVKKEIDTKESKTDVISISKITTDEKRFQNRGELNQDVVKNIAENFDLNQFDPIVVWKEGDKTLVLAGHHRLEGAKKSGVKSVPVRYFEGNEKQAIEYAKELSNANRSMETVVERANIYRAKLKNGESKKSVEEQAKKTEGKNASFILNVAALDPDGIAIQTFESFKNSEDKATQLQVNKVLDWVGNVRRQYAELTDQHEKELFDFLMDKESSKRFTTIADFKQKVTTIVGGFDFDATQPLNIARFKNKSQGEIEYDSQVEEVKGKINEVEKKIETLKNRFKDPKSEGYVSPETANYQELKKLADKTIENLNVEYQKLNKDLLDLYRNKGKFVNAGANQGSLFQKKAAKPSADIQKVVDVIKKALPKFTVKYDSKLDAAGKIQGNVITINPDYAGIDTPIHEAGHALIDFLGYKNSVVQAAIKQLKTSPLWTETKERYPELNDEMLAKEVLAEAIGREGAGIFDTEVEKSKFMQLLDRIFDKLKTLLGINKNVAKSLAKQIIRGETKNIESASADVQLAKKKKPIEDETEEEEAARLLKEQREEEERDVQALIEEINAQDDLNNLSNEFLTDAYNAVLATTLSTGKKSKYLKDVMVRIAMHLHDQELKETKAKNPKFNEQIAVNQDISFADVKLKVLSHFSEGFPTLQALSKLWDEHYFNKITEERAQKKTHENLAKDVIKDKNARSGIVERGVNAVKAFLGSNINHKYFDFIEGKDGKLLTVEEGQKKGLSAPQMAYLKFVRSLMKDRYDLISDEETYNADMEILKLDKGFSEAFNSDGAVQAFSNLLGNTHNIENVRIEYTNPNTGRKEITEFENIEKALVEYGKKGLKQRAEALAKIFHYNLKARRQLRLQVNADQTEDTNNLKIYKSGEYTLDEKGRLQSKFSRNRNPDRAYSKDFYKAVQEYISDSAHIKHVSPLMPIINSVTYLNKNGLFDREGDTTKTIHNKKENVGKWLDEWTKLHVLKKKEEQIPEVDMILRTLRFMTSASTMLFNVPANIINVAMGNYNNWRAQEFKTYSKGQSRLFGGTNRKLDKEHAFGALNKYSVDIIRKYGAVSTDVDSNPIKSGVSIFTDLGYALQKWGEFQIQGSGLLGLMTDEDYNSFEYKKNEFGVEELVVKKGVDEKALRARILANINKVSDVQGKYSEKDRMNIMNTEIGKSAAQFKTWMPMYFRERFGDEGTWRKMVRGGFAELRKDIKEKGKVKAFWENKAFMSNLKGAMVVGLMMAFVYNDDDDKKKDSAAKLMERYLSDLLFVFDFNNAKFTLTKPIASIGTLEKFIDLLDHMAAFEADDFYKGKSKYGEKGDSKVIGDVIGLTPGAKKMSEAVDFLEEEN